MRTTNAEKAKAVRIFCQQITEKAQKFAENPKNENFDDLRKVLNDLDDINNFLKTY